MSSANHHRVAMLSGHLDQLREQSSAGVNQRVTGITQGPALRGIHHISRGQAIVNPRGRRPTDALLNHIYEGCYIVVRGLLTDQNVFPETLIHIGRMLSAVFGIGHWN